MQVRVFESQAGSKPAGPLGANTEHNSMRKTKPDLHRDTDKGHRLQDQWGNQICHAGQECVETIHQRVSEIQSWQTGTMMMMMIKYTEKD